MNRHRRLLTAAALGLAVAPLCAAAAEEAAKDDSLERVRQRGRLKVAVYEDLAPFNLNGKGIDCDLAQALAQGLGVELSLLPFTAGENIADDLRNAVWKGHYLGWGPADVMLHVPLERPLLEANPQVEVVAPYYRERVMLAWDRERGPEPQSMAALAGKPVAVAGGSLAGWLLAGAEGGLLREGLATHHTDGVSAARSLLAGQAAAAAGLASELEFVLSASPRYAILALPTPRAPRDGWVLGCAVKKGATALAKALHERLSTLGAGPDLRAMFLRHGVVWRG